LLGYPQEEAHPCFIRSFFSELQMLNNEVHWLQGPNSHHGELADKLLTLQSAKLAHGDTYTYRREISQRRLHLLLAFRFDIPRPNLAGFSEGIRGN